jgi:hypothetical protein
LKETKEGTILHIYYDENGLERWNDFGKFEKEFDDEWCIDGINFPIDDLTDDTLLDQCPNCSWEFTIREAIGN